MFNNSSINENDKELISKMSGVIAHRGPDDHKSFDDGRAILDFRRLSIIDLDSGAQPAVLGNIHAVFNGEIYNYLELRDELIKEGESFKTRSEIEVILTLYRREGKDFIKKLRGMFAIAIYDKEKELVMLGRDPFGIKPLYYSISDGRIIFSSESKVFALDEKVDMSKINTEKLQHYFTFQYIPEPNTLNDKIKILKAGHYAVFDGKSNFCETRYFTPALRCDNKDSFENKAAELRKIIESSVKYHMISDVPVGSFLSSGIDSAIITATASKLNPGIKAFTVAFGEKEFSEIDNASAIAKHLDVEHIKLVAGVEDFKRAFEKVVYHLDFPVADPSTVAIYLICEEAAKNLKVVLSGEGSDELFGGYRVYNESVFSSKIYALPNFIKKWLLAISNRLPEHVKGKQLLWRGVTPLEERYTGNAFIFDEKSKLPILKTYDENVKFSQVTREYYNEYSHLSPMAKMRAIDINMWLRGDILVKSDRLSMAHSLEIRVPFLDKEVFNFASGLRDKDMLSHKTTKYILRYAFRDLLDDETFMRPKLGYPVPVKKWLKSELYDWAKDIIENSSADEYINKEEALRMLEAHRNGSEDNYRKLWVILVFIKWHQFYANKNNI